MGTIIRRKPHTYPGYLRDFVGTLLSSRWCDGPRIAEFEEKLATYVGARHTVATSYGLHALAIILRYHGIRAGDEVLIPGYTAVVVPMCLDELGIRYRCVDIDATRATMDAADLTAKIGPETKAVIVTHLLGHACDPRAVQIARDRGLVVIEDCAHALGTRIEAQHVGTLGHAGFFSFSYIKPLNTYTGGMLVTGDEKLAAFARQEISSTKAPTRRQLLRKLVTGHLEVWASHPLAMWLLTPVLRSPKAMLFLRNLLRSTTRGKMTAFTRYSNTQAVLGLRQLEHLDQVLTERRDLGERIRKQTSLTFLGSTSADAPYALVAVVEDPGSLHRQLLLEGVDTGLKQTFVDLIDPALPGSRYAFEHYLALPNYTGLTSAQLQQLTAALKRVRTRART